ncbi:MAG TPA: GNAT family N-acetyltransferase [Candidatus Lustribacter sp.]|nr:GNAT family N-acetyltransferase [Candidatus Lustribacter sp.]
MPAAVKLTVGQRVMLRYRRPEGGEPPLTDVVGMLVEVGPDAVVVQTRRGRVSIERRGIVAAKAVPPAPVRRGRPHRAIAIADLERVMASCWPPLESEPLGQWVLRASNGFTRRANSLLPIGDPGLPLTEAVDLMQAWYDARGLRRVSALAGPAGFAIEDDPLGELLLGRGYEPFNRTLVMTSATGSLMDVPADAPLVDVSDGPDEAWFSAWARDGVALTGTARQVIRGRPPARFASALRPDAATVGAGAPRGASRVVGIGQLMTAPGWGGLYSMYVDPDERRRGVATAILAALAGAAGTLGIQSLYLQAAVANTAAVRRYTALGFATHHEYVYLGSGPTGAPRG